MKTRAKLSQSIISSWGSWLTVLALVLALAAVSIGTTLAHGKDSLEDCITKNNATTSFQVEVPGPGIAPGTAPNGSTADAREFVINATTGKVILFICIKSGKGTFDWAARTVAHSAPIMEDGDFGIDLEPDDDIGGCFQVSGISTARVTVTVVGDGPDANDSENCKDLSHTDVFTNDPG